MRYLVGTIVGVAILLNVVSCKQSTGNEIQKESGEKVQSAESAEKSEQSSDAESETSSDSDGKQWAKDLFGEELVKRDKTTVSADKLDDDKKIGLYFSAHWCPPCRAFTPVLVETYNKIKEEGKPFEIVLVDLDRTEEDMFGYMDGEKMEWLAVPFDGPRQKIAQQFGVRGIPSLVILDAEGNVITKDGRSAVSSQGANAYEQW